MHRTAPTSENGPCAKTEKPWWCLLRAGGGQGSLVCCSPWGPKVWTRLSIWTELKSPPLFCDIPSNLWHIQTNLEWRKGHPSSIHLNVTKMYQMCVYLCKGQQSGLHLCPPEVWCQQWSCQWWWEPLTWRAGKLRGRDERPVTWRSSERRIHTVNMDKETSALKVGGENTEGLGRTEQRQRSAWCEKAWSQSGTGALGRWGAGMDCVELQDREWGQPSFCCIYFFWNTGHMFLFQIFIAFLLFAMVTLLCSWESCHFMQYLKGKKGFCLKYKWSSFSWGQN